MNSGQREDRILIQQPTQVKDAIGGYSTTWSTYANIWGEVTPMQGSEAFEYGQLTQGNGYRVMFLYDDAPLIDMNMRVRSNGDILSIHSIVKHKRENMIELICYVKSS